MRSVKWALALVLSVVSIAAGQSKTPAAATSTLRVTPLEGKSTTLNSADFKNRIHVSATDHDGKQHDFEGIDLRGLLTQFGVPAGHDLRGKEMADYIVAEASDGYRVIFSLAELDPEMGNSQVVIVDKMDGQALDAHDGPFRLVVPEDKRPARWIRMLTSLTILRAQ